MAEEFLFCRPLFITTTGEDIFKIVDSFITEEGLPWDQCFSACCVGAPAVLGARQCFIGRVKAVNPQVIVFHCFLHLENIASKRLSPKLQAVRQEFIQVVNFIKSRSLNYRFFKEMCSDFGSDHVHFMYHSEVRSLSRGKTLQPVVALLNEAERFLLEKN